MTTQEEDLLGKQENEHGPKVVQKSEDGHRHCFVCHKPIEVGQSYFHIRCGSSTIRRHTTCKRKRKGLKKQPPGQASIWGGRAVKKEIEDRDAQD